VSDGDSTLKVFDLDKDTLRLRTTTGRPCRAFGTVRTGVPLVTSTICARNTNLSNAPTPPGPCGDMRADEMSFDSGPQGPPGHQR